jgi:hypothetical protein
MKIYMLKKLNDMERRYVYLRCFERKNNAEIANELGLSIKCTRLISVASFNKINQSILNRPQSLRSQMKNLIYSLENIDYSLNNNEIKKIRNLILDAITNSWIVATKIAITYKRKPEFVKTFFNEYEYKHIKTKDECLDNFKKAKEMVFDIMLLDLPNEIVKSIILCNEIRIILEGMLKFFEKKT